jgi:hypothetical protein
MACREPGDWRSVLDSGGIRRHTHVAARSRLHRHRARNRRALLADHSTRGARLGNSSHCGHIACLGNGAHRPSVPSSVAGCPDAPPRAAFVCGRWRIHCWTRSGWLHPHDARVHRHHCAATLSWTRCQLARAVRIHLPLCVAPRFSATRIASSQPRGKRADAWLWATTGVLQGHVAGRPLLGARRLAARLSLHPERIRRRPTPRIRHADQSHLRDSPGRSAHIVCRCFGTLVAGNRCGDC